MRYSVLNIEKFLQIMKQYINLLKYYFLYVFGVIKNNIICVTKYLNSEFCAVLLLCESAKSEVMECLIGIKGTDFVLVASDTTAGRSIVKMKQGSSKI